MDPKYAKLAVVIKDGPLAEKLVQAGFDNPAKVRRATDAELRRVEGVGPVAIKAIRKKLPRRK